MVIDRDEGEMRLEARYGDRIVRCYPERLPSLGAYFARWVAERPGNEAFVWREERLDWREADRRVAILAARLAARGVGRGERVLLMLGNGLPFVLAQFALERLGAIAIPVSIRESRDGLRHIAVQSRACAILYDPELSERLPPAVDCPNLGIAEPSDGPLFDLRDNAVAPIPHPAAIDELATGYIFYTSGTTGRPKGAMVTNANIVHSAMTFVKVMGLGPADRSICVAPMSHVTGIVGLIAAVMVGGGTLIIHEGFDVEKFLGAAARERMTHTVMVPAMYNLCLMRADLAAYDLSAWRLAGYGGAPMPEVTIARLGEALPQTGLFNFYGATEATSAVTVLRPEETRTRASSVGRRWPGADILVMDPEGREVPTGTIGEIWIGGPTVVPGYWDDRAGTAAAFCGGFWKSGDLGLIDDEGYVYVVDRLKDMINRGGYKVFSAEVEAAIASHPAVFEAAVVGRPCPVLGERTHAFVALHSEAGAIGAETLAAHLSDLIADYKCPDSWTIGREPLPRNANGKIIKKDLRERLLASER